ncbi:tetratricopeptide repeat protein [Frankia sp. AgB1.9]|uniref:tetratricopeptide repeat protein n=1 Tax=unclassified Frankia TaxID=2632575 RepID=UPI0019315B44|nr:MULTISPECIES: tetratricopeptide repeat protein [unclassified Frankia]MBL7491075.1 tetratricopeptide repeat protein [Frankia sp. AgW1.1]MBL7553117.1 tetratricopeptide repeat protein [Frankia sp. AgB1.9]MBL7623032.1 tetratricopeptide repeat protein [Frankia sp. AgB1.8]
MTDRNDRPRSLQDRIRARQAHVFVGRQEQLRQFEENLGLPLDDPRQRFLFSVYGDAGIGKTFLVRQLARVAREKGWLTAYVDHAVADVPETMASIVAQLTSAGARCKDYADRHASYQQRRGELASDPNAPDGLATLLTRTAVRVGLHAAGDVPFAGAVTEAIDADAAADQVDRFRRFIAAKFRNNDDQRLVMSPVEALMPAFLADLGVAAEHAPVALFVDTYERTSTFLDRWLLDMLGGRYGDLPERLVLTVAGQHPLDVNRWAEFYGLRADIPLRVFTDDEASELLAARGVTDPRVTDVMLTLSGRLPVLLAMLAESRPASPEEVGDPSGDAVERFLRWEEDDARRQAALLAALPRRLDADILAAALGTDGDSAGATFGWLRTLPFVSSHTEGFQYHDVVRGPMLRQVRRNSPNAWRAAHLRLADLYGRRVELTGLSGGEGWREDSWRANRSEEAYHRLCANEPGALANAMHCVMDAYHWTTPEAARRCVEAMTAAGVDAALPVPLDRGGTLLALLRADDFNEIVFLDGLIADVACDAKRRARLLSDRGWCQVVKNDLDRAVEDATAAAELKPDLVRAWAIRGEAHRQAGRLDEAVADLSRAVDLNSRYIWAVYKRGLALLSAEDYEGAVLDFDRVPEIDEDYPSAIALRGEANRLNGNYGDALTDFNRALERTPDAAWIIGSRGQVHQEMGSHEKAIADYDRALAVDAEILWIINERGLSYREIGKLDEALADFNRALELEPDSDWQLAQRGEAHRLAGSYADALADFDRAIDIDPEYAWAIGRRGRVYRNLERFGEAVADFDRALVLEPDSGSISAQRGETYRVAGSYLEALADFDRAIELEGEDDYAVYKRGQTYWALGRHGEALTDLARSFELDPTDGFASYMMGLVQYDMGDSEGAAGSFLRALEADMAELAEQPGEARASFNIAVYLQALGRVDEAVERAAATFQDQPSSVDVRDFVDDVHDLRRVTGKNVDRLVDLLPPAARELWDAQVMPTSGMPGDETPVAQT